MAHTYASNFVHCIFSAKDRRSLIPASRKSELYAYLGGIARGEGFSFVAAGGTENHIHLLLLLPPAHSLAQAVQKLKGSSSRWMGKDFSGRRDTARSASVHPKSRSSKDISEIRSSITANAVLSRNLRPCCVTAESNTMNVMCSDDGGCRRPYGTLDSLHAATAPTLKRGATERCACGAWKKPTS